MATGDKTKVGQELFMQYISFLPYKEGDMVWYDKKIYRAKQATPMMVGTLPTYNDKWFTYYKPVVNWIGGQAYVVGSTVTTRNKYYISILASTSLFPSDFPTYWKEISVWDANTSYVAGDLVLNYVNDKFVVGSLFKKASVSSVGISPYTNSHWELVYDPTPVVRNLTQAGHNGFSVIINDRLFTTHGSSTGTGLDTWDDTSGRGLKGEDPFVGIDNLKQVSVSQASKVKDAGGMYHSFAYALCENGDLYTWGRNTNGQCGLGHTNAVQFPTYVTGSVSEVFTHPTNNSYDANKNRLFIRKTDGYIYGCGYNEYGAVGVGSTAVNVPSFTVIPNSNNIKTFYNLGATYGCIVGLTNSGRIFMAGYNGWKQFGTTTAYFTNFTDLTSYWVSPSDKTTNLVATGGFGSYDGTTIQTRSTLMLMLTLTSTTLNVSIGNYLVTCGSNNYGQIGDNTTTDRSSPYYVTGVKPYSVDVGGGSWLTVHVVDWCGNLIVWGYNVYGNCGLITQPLNQPVTINYQTCRKSFIGNNNSHFDPWYNNSFIKIYETLNVVGSCQKSPRGDGNITNLTTTTFTPVLLPVGDRDVVELGCFYTNGSRRVVVALTSKGNLYAWGSNYSSGFTNREISETKYCPTPVQINIPEVY